MNTFQPTHKLMAPAGEEIPVMLVAETENMNYLVISEIEHQEGKEPFYQWHPARGVTYNGLRIDGLEILPLASKKYQDKFTETKSRNTFSNQLMVL